MGANGASRSQVFLRFGKSLVIHMHNRELYHTTMKKKVGELRGDIGAIR
jgi:hypothetical protein